MTTKKSKELSIYDLKAGQVIAYGTVNFEQFREVVKDGDTWWSIDTFESLEDAEENAETDEDILFQVVVYKRRSTKFLPL